MNGASQHGGRRLFHSRMLRARTACWVTLDFSMTQMAASRIEWCWVCA